ncbi:cyclic pyranopterin monophosphate synthase MoaC [Euzebya tangerina]|uniref:cyclic pyranopterin monophosphate synthase MoaC n=1 Tax=Euzebya tangerina TaxID=591198 RepID=UPI000E3214E2|nr:cyclic pyranopterin monophosphate synthase MoaC [Euzebya tangerina]
MSTSGQRSSDAGGLTHVDESGHARMVDVSGKPVTSRTATASALVRMAPATAELLVAGGLPKGDALPVARLAGVTAAKRTPDLIPLCHVIALAGVEVEVDVDAEAGTARVVATARAADRTGVEMEAMVAASTAALTLYDMTKAVDKGILIEQVRLEAKTGGKSGDWHRDRDASGGGQE